MKFISDGNKTTFGLLILLLCSPWVIDASRNRQKYGGRVLNIAPKECSSPKFPNVTGTCMISLECQQRSGTVIGACRDGLLFGACCHDPNEAVTAATSTESPVTTATSTETAPTTASISDDSRNENVSTAETTSLLSTSSFKNVDETTTATGERSHATSEILSDDLIPSSNLSPSNTFKTSLLFKDKNVESSTTESTTTSNEVTNLGSVINANSSEKPSTTESTTTSNEVTTLGSVINLNSSESPTTIATIQEINDPKKSTAGVKSDLILSKEQSTTFYNAGSSIEGTSTASAVEPIVVSSVETSTLTPSSTEGTTIPSSPTTKFFYGKIKYTPKPYKFRATTRKTLWTRPPSTEKAYSAVTTDSDEDEEDEMERDKRPSRPVKTTPIESPTTVTASASVETTTLVKSTEEATTFTSSATSTTTTTTTTTAIPVETVKSTVKPIESPVTEIPTTTENIPEVTTISELASSENATSNPNLVKQSRLSNKITSGNGNGEDSYDNDSSYSLDNKLDDFVNQVVEGIAEELDKSNIDDVFFKSTTTSTTTTTTTTEKPITKRKKYKPKGSSSSVHSSNKNKTQTHHSSPSSHSNKTKTHGSSKSKGSSKQKKKPTKKVTIVKDENETEVVLDYKKACGVRPLARQSRIVGGTPSSYGNWPWHALVKETAWWGIFSKVKCGGVLIGARHVLTAAHCQPQQTGTLSVVLGVTDSDNPNINAVTKGVRRVIRHPQFNPRSYENDIAILELDSPVEFQPHIVPICLPDLNELFEGKEGFVTGMGLLKHDGERPLILHQVDVPILNNSECQSMFRRSGNSKPIQPSFICAGYAQGLKDSCGGDSGLYTNTRMMRHDQMDEQNLNETDFSSGGPLSVRRSNGQWVLAGTVSHGIKCAVPNQPGVYMRTTWYRPWIEKVTRIARGRDSPKCNGPPWTCDNPQARSRGFLETLFRVFRLARRMWKSRK